MPRLERGALFIPLVVSRSEAFSVLFDLNENLLSFSGQCKEIEENNRMGKTINLFKKIRDTKGTFHGKMGSITNRKDTELTEAEDIKMWQE